MQGGGRVDGPVHGAVRLRLHTGRPTAPGQQRPRTTHRLQPPLHAGEESQTHANTSVPSY